MGYKLMQLICAALFVGGCAPNDLAQIDSGPSLVANYESAPSSSNKIEPKFDYQWPLTGDVILEYSQMDGRPKNDGVNISAPLGTPVYAALDGNVAYATDSMKSYGNMVLLMHAGGYFTVYAHLQDITVHKGQFVYKGTQVGSVGLTGGVSQPQLHFEIREKNIPINPRRYLPSDANSALSEKDLTGGQNHTARYYYVYNMIMASLPEAKNRKTFWLEFGGVDGYMQFADCFARETDKRLRPEVDLSRNEEATLEDTLQQKEVSRICGNIHLTGMCHRLGGSVTNNVCTIGSGKSFNIEKSLETYIGHPNIWEHSH